MGKTKAEPLVEGHHWDKIHQFWNGVKISGGWLKFHGENPKVNSCPHLPSLEEIHVPVFWDILRTSVKSRNVKESGKVVLDPHLESSEHQNVTTSRWSPQPPPTKFGQHPWTRSWVNLQTNRQIHRPTHAHNDHITCFAYRRTGNKILNFCFRNLSHRQLSRVLSLLHFQRVFLIISVCMLIILHELAWLWQQIVCKTFEAYAMFFLICWCYSKLD